MSQFNLTIALGNAAMSSRLDILEALYGVINDLQEFRDKGTILDINGNTVGSWEINLCEQHAVYPTQAHQH